MCVFLGSAAVALGRDDVPATPVDEIGDATIDYRRERQDERGKSEGCGRTSTSVVKLPAIDRNLDSLQTRPKQIPILPVVR